MSPDDDSVTEPQLATEEPVATDVAESGMKKSFKDRTAFIGKAGDSMGKYPVFNKIPKALRLLFVLVLVLIVVLAVWAVAALPGDDGGPSGPKTLDVTKLDDFSWDSGPITAYLNEFQSAPYRLADIESWPTNGTVFIESVDAYLEWQDEPNSRFLGRERINYPDHFAIEINASSNASMMGTFAGNDVNTKQGSTQLSLAFSAVGYDYVAVGNTTGVNLPEGVLIEDVFVIVHMDEAENMRADGPAQFLLNDFGNDYTLNIHVTGKVISE
jgi:hypothetical protein